MSRGSYLKDLANLGTLDDDVDFVVCDDTLSTPDDKKGYKVSAADVKSYIGSPTPTPPLTLQDAGALSTSASSFTTTGDSYATLGSGTDYTNLSIGDMIYAGSRPGDGSPYVNFVIDKVSSPTIRIVPTGTAITVSTFSYGDPSIILEDYVGNIRGGWGTRGFAVDGSISVDGSIDTSFNVYTEAVKTSLIGFRGNTQTTHYLYSDGHVEKPSLESFCASRSSTTAVGSGSWYKAPYNTISSYNFNHSNVPTGWSGYDTTNYCFQVPYYDTVPASVYSDTLSYTFSFSLSMYAMAMSSTLVEARLGGAATATASSLAEIFLYDRTTLYTYSGGAGYNFTLKGTITVELSPNTNPNHRYISVWYQVGGTAIAPNITGGQGYSSFSGVYNGGY